MIQSRTGRVIEILSEDDHIQNLKVDINGHEHKAVNYLELTGKVEKGNSVLLNTTAVTLGLGTGGVHFVMCNLDSPENEPKWNGHIMKLRYTPMQLKCNVLEEQEPYKDIFEIEDSIDQMPVFVATLHSMLAPIACSVKINNPKLKICYVMTDGAALPMSFSNTVKELKNKKIIDSTITIGHAFGGDYECINIYSALIAAKYVLKADVVIVAMGPGIVGSGSKFGFTGMEQGYIIDAVNNLNGKSIFCPRVSFADKRDRHYGLSHHSITTLKFAVNTKTTIVFAETMDEDKKNYIKNQLDKNKINEKHEVIFKTENTENALNNYGIRVSTMRRNFAEDKEFFITAGACANYLDEFIK